MLAGRSRRLPDSACGRASAGPRYGVGPRAQVRELLVPLVTDQNANVEISGHAALALGIVFSGACEEECVGAALQARAPARKTKRVVLEYLLCSVFLSSAGSQVSQCLWKCATNIVAGAVRVLPRRPSSRAASAFCSPPWQWAVAGCGADDEAHGTQRAQQRGGAGAGADGAGRRGGAAARRPTAGAGAGAAVPGPAGLSGRHPGGAPPPRSEPRFLHGSPGQSQQPPRPRVRLF